MSKQHSITITLTTDKELNGGVLARLLTEDAGLSIQAIDIKSIPNSSVPARHRIRANWPKDKA